MFIVDHYYTMTARQISETIGCSLNKVTNTWYKYGLHGKIKRRYYIEHEDLFSKIDNPISAYYLGLLAADGCLYDRKGCGENIVRMSLKRDDEDILRRFAHDLGTEKPITYSSGKYANFEISSTKMFNDLINIGLSTNKTYKNIVPDIDRSLMKYFIRGYTDGDGNVSSGETGNDIRVSISGYEYNLLKIGNYLESVNIISSFYEDKRFYNEGSGRFGSLVMPNIISKYCFAKHIYEDDPYPAMNRKKKICQDICKTIEDNVELPKYKIVVIYYNHAVQEVS